MTSTAPEPIPLGGTLSEPSAERSTPDRPDGGAMAMSLSGWDEIAVERAFGKPPTQLVDTFAGRSAVFVQLRREGQDDTNAYNMAMSMTLGEVKDFFPSKPEDEPGQEPGKAPRNG